MDHFKERLGNLSASDKVLLEQKLMKAVNRPRQAPTISPKLRADRTTALSFAQQRLWFLDQLLAESPVYNISTAFRLSGLLDIRCLDRSLKAVIERHEVLRTTIGSAEGKPCQIVQENLPFELVTHDLRVWPEVEREAEASRLLAQDAKRPFNLTRDLMIRGMLIRLTEDEHVLLIVMHHIASDGWSMGILMRELSHFYEAEISGRPSTLPELPIQYADYAEWQLEWLQGDVLNRQLDYWKQQLAGVPTRLNLPTDRPRPAVQTFRGASRHIELSSELAQALKALSLREKTSLFMTLLAAFQVMLFRYTGQDDIVLGSPIAGRNRGEVEDLIGFFVNTLALRTDLSGDPTFLELLRRVREVALEAYDHQDLPFERLVEDLHSERSLSHNPLFQVMFILQNAPSSPLKLLGIQASPVRLAAETAHFDLTMSITERRPGLIARLSYSTDLFDEATIERMLGHFEVLLEGIVKRPDERISRLPWLKEAEERQLQEWNPTRRTTHSRDRDLPALFEAQVDRTPEAVALEFEGEGLTYSELNRRANQLAHWLNKLGIGPDVLVALYMERSVETMVSVLGVLKAGGAYVPMDTAYPHDRLAFMLTDASPRVVITQQRLRSRIPDQNWSILCLDSESESLQAQNSDNPRLENTPESLAYVIYTSGSTGRPKGVAMTRQALVNLIGWQCRMSSSKGSSRTLQFTSLSFDVSFQEIFSTWCSGGSLVLIQEPLRRDSLALLRFVQEERIDRLFLPFIALEHLAEAAASYEVLPSTLKEVYTAGEQLIITPNILGLFENLPGCSLHNHYGPSESHVVTAYPLPVLESQWQLRPPIGRPIENCLTYILDDQLRPVPVGVAGELFIGGDCLARGYLDRPELTAERFIPNPSGQTEGERLYRTGDLARYLPDGNIEFLGRTDHQVKLRGFRIELGEIESVLTQHSGVREAVVAVREDVPGDQRLVAYVVGNDGPCDGGELRSLLSKQVPDYMVPSAYVFLDALPLTPSGKVDRRGLPAVSAEKTGVSGGYIGPRNEIERALAGVWEELLNVRPVGVRDNFFELGGHSLLATRLIARMEKTLGRKVSLASLFQSPTIEGLANELQEGARHLSLTPFQIEGSKQREEQPIRPRRDTGQPAPLSFAQQRLWFIDRLLPASSLYNLPTAIRLRGVLNIECLRQSIDAVVRRHDVLRTTINDIDGEPFQIATADHAVELRICDLTSQPELQRESEASNLLAEEASRPFDLARELMLRALLIKLTEEEHVLLLVMHHIASDGWSLSILMRELSHYYRGYVIGKPERLTELPIQYADYAVWQREWLQGEVLEEQLSYWKQNLSGAPRVLELPTDRPRPAIQTFQGASQRTELSPQLTQDLRLLCHREKVTLFMTLLAAFQILLSRYTGRDDIVVGSPIAGRNRSEAEDLIGFFVNTLALRTDLSGNPTFLELLGRVRKVALEAYAHQDVPFEKLVDELQIERDLSRHSLVQVMFALQNAPQEKLALPGIDTRPMRIRNSDAKFDLTLWAAESGSGSGLTIGLGYGTDLYEAAAIERMLAHFRVLINGVVEHPERRLSELPLLTKEEWVQLKQWNETGREYARERCLSELFEAQVERRAEAVAVVCENRRLSYGELNRRANQLGHYLRKRGVGPEVLVGVCMNRSEAMVVGLLGILKAGGAYVPLELTYPGERLKVIIQDAGITVLLTEQEVLKGLLDARIGKGLETICVDRDRQVIEQEKGSNLQAAGTSEALAYVMYTSGSTGEPKGVGIPQRAVSRLVVNASYVRFGEEEVFLQMAPPSFDASTFELWGALLNGSRCVLYPGGTPNLTELSRQIERNRVTTLWLTASLFNTVIDEGAEILRPIRQLLIGGETLSVTHVRQAQEQLPNTQILNGYGPTENTTFTCCHPIPRVLDSGRSIPIGRSISNTQVYLLDKHLNPVPVGVVGELYTGGEGLARGYLGRADLTAEQFIPNPFGQTGGDRLYRTGDLARWLADGSIEFMGRVDNQIKLRGFRIELGEIEAALCRHSSVEQAVVICREDRGEKRLVAYFTGKGGKASITELRRFLKMHMPDYMIPGAFVRLDRVPLTANGKVDRQALPEPVVSEGPGGSSYRPPRDRLELQLAEIWESLLHVEHAGVTDNFFDLGGHSLLAVKLLAQINQSFGRNLPLVSVFQAPTVEQMASLLRQQGWKPLGESLVVVQPNGSNPPFFCVHGIVGCPRLAAYLGQEQPLYGLVQGLDGNRFFTRVEDLAAHYLKDIKMICPQGPYLLGGYSFGGLVAFEMAQQLSRAGEEVGLLALIDPTTPRGDHQPSSTEGHSNSERRSSSEGLGTRILRHLRQLRELPRKTRSTYVRRRFGMMMTLAGNKGKRLTCEIYLRLGWSMPPAFRTFYIGEVLFGAHYLVASKAYRPEPFAGRVVLIHTRRKGAFDPEDIWRELIPNQLTSHLMPGDHFEILREPLIGILAGHLRDGLEQVHETKPMST